MEFAHHAIFAFEYVPDIDVTNFPIVTQYWLPACLVIVPLYMLLVFVGPILMRNRKPIDCPNVMMAWNLALSLMSLGVFIRVSMAVLPYSFAHGSEWFRYLVTLPDEDYTSTLWRGPQAFWMWVYGLSKVVELGDTVFLVIRKRPVPFLHWYHHTTVLLFCWFSMSCLAGPSFFFGIMNSFVHIIMYFYYFLTGLNYRPSWGKYLTQLQLLQMVGGLIAAGTWTYYTYATVESTRLTYPVHHWIVGSSFVIYASYFYLFLVFYIGRHISARNAAAAAAANNNTNTNTNTSTSTTNNTTTNGTFTKPSLDCNTLETTVVSLTAATTAAAAANGVSATAAIGDEDDGDARRRRHSLATRSSDSTR